MCAAQLFVYLRHPLRERIAVKRPQSFRITLVPVEKKKVDSFSTTVVVKRRRKEKELPDVPQTLRLET